MYLDRFRWMVLLDCSHHRQMGTTLPIEVLEARGLVNKDNGTPDPRLVQRGKDNLDAYYKREFDKIYRLLQGVSHWMDGAGMVHTNPCYKQSVRRISQYASLKMNHEEMRQVYMGVRRMLAEVKNQRILAPNEEALSKVSSRIGGRTVQRKSAVQTDAEGRKIPVRIQVERKNLHSTTDG